MEKVIVTGANGFIGTAVCIELSKCCKSIIALVRDESSDTTSLESITNLSIIYCDMENYYRLDEIVGEKNIDVCFHLAWQGSAGILRGDVETQLDNIKNTCNLVEACSRIGCKRFVYASSIMEYEVAAVMKTELIPRMNSLYSVAKGTANNMARILAGELEIEYLRVIISNVYGPKEKSVRLVFSSLLKLLNGEHCAFSSGEQMYDFIYIDDAAKMIVAIAEKGVNNREYYLGSLQPKPLREFLIEMRNQIDSQIEIGLGEIPYEGVSLRYDEFDVFAVQNDIGVTPKISFQDGIRRTIEWLQEEKKHGRV